MRSASRSWAAPRLVGRDRERIDRAVVRTPGDVTETNSVGPQMRCTTGPVKRRVDGVPGGRMAGTLPTPPGLELAPLNSRSRPPWHTVSALWGEDHAQHLPHQPARPRTEHRRGLRRGGRGSDPGRGPGCYQVDEIRAEPLPSPPDTQAGGGKLRSSGPATPSRSIRNRGDTAARFDRPQILGYVLIVPLVVGALAIDASGDDAPPGCADAPARPENSRFLPGHNPSRRAGPIPGPAHRVSALNAFTPPRSLHGDL